MTRDRYPSWTPIELSDWLKKDRDRLPEKRLAQRAWPELQRMAKNLPREAEVEPVFRELAAWTPEALAPPPP